MTLFKPTHTHTHTLTHTHTHKHTLSAAQTKRQALKVEQGKTHKDKGNTANTGPNARGFKNKLNPKNGTSPWLQAPSFPKANRQGMGGGRGWGGRGLWDRLVVCGEGGGTEGGSGRILGC